MVLHVTILCAENLEKKHTDPNYNSDPYIVVSLDNSSTHSTSAHLQSTTEHFRTQAQKNTLNPQFNESFHFEIPRNSTFDAIDVIFEVYDWHVIGKNASMGQAQTNLSILRKQIIECVCDDDGKVIDNGSDHDESSSNGTLNRQSEYKRRKKYIQQPQRLKLPLFGVKHSGGSWIEVELMADETDFRW